MVEEWHLSGTAPRRRRRVLGVRARCSHGGAGKGKRGRRVGGISRVVTCVPVLVRELRLLAAVCEAAAWVAGAASDLDVCCRTVATSTISLPQAAEVDIPVVQCRGAWRNCEEMDGPIALLHNKVGDTFSLEKKKR